MAQNPNDYAIVIGIDSYSQLRLLQAARKDADEFAGWLTSPEGGGLPASTDNIRIIKSPEATAGDPVDARPIKRDIDQALRDFGIKNDGKIGRRLYFYFAGHGFAPDFDDVGMLMADAALDSLNNNIGLRPYRRLLRERGPFDEVVFILDCCRDNFKHGKSGEPEFTLDAKTPTPNVADFIVLAAAYGEGAFERNGGATGEPRGVLTQVLLEALRGERPEAIDDLNRVTAFTLRSHLPKRVKELATDEKLRQEPEIPALPSSDLVFCTVDDAKIKTCTVNVIAPKGLKGDLVLLDGNSNERDRRAAQSCTQATPWVIPLPLHYSSYVITHTESEAELMFNPSRAKKDPYVLQFPKPE